MFHYGHGVQYRSGNRDHDEIQNGERALPVVRSTATTWKSGDELTIRFRMSVSPSGGNIKEVVKQSVRRRRGVVEG